MAPVLSKTPETLVTSGWSDYALLDSGDGKKLERYGRYTVVRPEPQCFWSPRDPKSFENATATFDPQQEEEDSGRWRFDKHGPIDAFPLKWRDVKFTGRFTPFRHLAFFPEQAANWEWLDGRVRDFTRSAGRAPKILNLFGYIPITLPHFLTIGIVPVLLGISMFFQFRMNPTPMDDTQKQVFAIMPWVLMFVMAPFAVGLQVYWITTNCVSILQQKWLYSRHPQLKNAPAK